MGKPAQKRIIRKIGLEMFLSQIKASPSPKANLEQYIVNEDVAATMLHLAAYRFDNIIGKTILDLGCGTGRLSLGASFLGAKSVVGIDIDKTVVKIASHHSDQTGLNRTTQWIVGDIDAVQGRFDTVLENPPFGVQRRSADQKFLEKALDVGNVIYSFHNHPETDKDLISRLKSGSQNLLQIPPSGFIKDFVESHNGQVIAVFALLMAIPHMFDFHTKARHQFVVDLYVIKRDNLDGEKPKQGAPRKHVNDQKVY